MVQIKANSVEVARFLRERGSMNSMTRTGRVLWLLFLTFSVGCSVWSVWQLFTDADRVVSAVVVGIVTLAVARPAVTNLVWAVSLLFWKPLKCVDSLYEWLQSPQGTEDADTSMLPPESSARELLEHLQQEGVPADRNAAAEALKFLPTDGQPTVQQVREARAALGGSLEVRAWKALQDLDEPAA